MTTAKALALVCLGFALGVLGTGLATDLEIEYGQCRFGKAQDGTFYDSKMNPNLYLTPRCAEIAVGSKFRGSTYGWRVGFIQSGSVESRDSLAPMHDGVYNPNPCSNEHWANCHSLFGGSGRMRGISVALTKEADLGGKWWAQGEAGVLFFEHFFNGYAKPQDYDGAPMVTGGHVAGTAQRWEGANLNQSSKLPGMPIPRFGGRIGYGPLYFSMRYHLPPGTLGLWGHDGSSVTNHSYLQVTAGLRVKL